MKKIINITIIGYGYWGKINHRLIEEIKGFRVVGIIDPNLATAGLVNKIPFDGLEASVTDAAYIATPPATHYKLAKTLLQRGLSVILEKPATLKASEYARLTELATKNNVALIVDHTFLYDPLVEAVKIAIEIGTIGEIRGVETARTHFGNYRFDVSPLWDLAVHDISILQYLFGERKTRLNNICNIDTLNQADYLALDYSWGLIRVSTKVSWAYPLKTRTMVVFGDKGTICVDLLAREASVQFFSMEAGGPQITRTTRLKFKDGETLLLAWRAFYEKIRNKTVEKEAKNIIESIEIMEKKLNENTNR